MSGGPGNVSRWTLSAAQMAQLEAGASLASLDLGTPDRIDPPILVMTCRPSSAESDGKMERPKLIMPITKPKRDRRRTKISVEQYFALLAKGHARDSVAEHLGIKRRTLTNYLTDWGIGQPSDEAAALEAYRRGAR